MTRQWGMEALKAKTEAHEKKKTTREMSDCEQQPLSQLDYTDLFCFFQPLTDIFGSSVISWLSKDLLFSSRGHILYWTGLYSSAWRPTRLWLYRPIKQPFNQEVTFDLWPKNLQRKEFASFCDGLMGLYLWGNLKKTKTWFRSRCKLFFGKLSRGAASYCMWLTFSLSAATSKDCSQQVDLPNVLIVLLHRSVHLHEQT